MSRLFLFCICFVTLILPYAFPTDTMWTTFGVGGIAKGHLQEQLLFGGTIFGSADDARGLWV
jgi:hypothetical protein